VLRAAVTSTAVTAALIATVPNWHDQTVVRHCSVGRAGALVVAVPVLLALNCVAWMLIAPRWGAWPAAMTSALLVVPAVAAGILLADHCTTSVIPPVPVVPPASVVHHTGQGPTAAGCGGAASDLRILAGSWTGCDDLRFGFAVDPFGNELDDLVTNIATCYPVVEGGGTTVYPRASEVQHCLTAASAGLDDAYSTAAPALSRYLPNRPGPCRHAIDLFTRDVSASNADSLLARQDVADGDVRGSYAAATRLANRYVSFVTDRVNIQSACVTQ
jgi:hypothetical protein